MLADGRIRAVVFTERPDNPGALSVEDWNGATTIHDQILKSDFNIGATGSDTVADAPLSSRGNAQAPGFSNYSGVATVLRFLTEAGQSDEDDDHVWELFREKGTTLYIGVSEGKLPDDPGAAGDEYSLYHIVTDDPQRPSDRTGYIKRTVNLFVQNAWENKELAAA